MGGVQRYERLPEKKRECKAVDVCEQQQAELKGRSIEKAELEQALHEISTLSSRLRLAKNISVSTKIELDRARLEIQRLKDDPSREERDVSPRNPWIPREGSHRGRRRVTTC